MVVTSGIGGNKPKKWRNHEEYCFVQMWGTVLWTNEHLFGELCNLLVRPGLRHFNTKTVFVIIILLYYTAIYTVPLLLPGTPTNLTVLIWTCLDK